MSKDLEPGSPDRPAESSPEVLYLPISPVQNDDLDLRSLFRIVWGYRWLLFIVPALFVVASVFIALNITPLYRASVLMAPVSDETSKAGLAGLAGQFGGLASLAGINLGGQNDATTAIATLRSRSFTTGWLQERNLLPVLFYEDWDADQRAWLVEDDEEIPTLWDAFEYFSESIRSVDQNDETGLVTLVIEWMDREQAAAWANDLAARINQKLRAQAIIESEASIAYLNGALDRTSNLEVKRAISSLIEDQIKTMMLANVREEYAFKLIDAAVVPEGDPVWPNKKLIVFLSGVAGVMFSVFLMLMHYVYRSVVRPRED